MQFVTTSSTLYALLHFRDVQLDVGLKFEVFFMGRVYLLLNVVLEVGHLPAVSVNTYITTKQQNLTFFSVCSIRTFFLSISRPFSALSSRSCFCNSLNSSILILLASSRSLCFRRNSSVRSSHF